MTRSIVVGAGMSGLMAARALHAAGRVVVVLDKGRSPGGRLATRRIETPHGTARVDHGAQFFTVRSERLAREVDAWQSSGVVREWCRGFGPEPDGHPRYVGADGMTGIAKHVAEGLDVRCGRMVFAIRRGETSAWSVGLDDGTALAADELVVTCPLPQSYSLLVAADLTLPTGLLGTEYDRTLTLLVVLDGDGAVPEPGGVQQADSTFSFIADNRAKGVSRVPALTFHAEPGYSDAQSESDPEAVHADLLERAHPWLGGAAVVASQLKRWRFARPRTLWAEPCWVAPPSDVPGPLVLAGDAFAGPAGTHPNLEGAALSGLAAADVLTATS